MKMTQQMFDRMTANAHIRKRDIIIGNFLGGLFWGFGTVVGATLVFGVLYYSLKSIDWIPIVGDFAKRTTQTIEEPPAKLPIRK